MSDSHPDQPAPHRTAPDQHTAEPVSTPALAHLTAHGITFKVQRHQRANSLAEAAAARGVATRDLVKTLVVRRGREDFVFFLVPGDREFSWPRARAALGVNRLSMPDAATAQAVTGYERGTITPFGASTPWPVVADASIVGRTISMGGGDHGVGVLLAADDVIAALGAQVAQVCDEPGTHDE